MEHDMKTQKKILPLKNGAATFSARGCSAPSITVPEFKYNKQINIDFHTKTNLFALELIRLWTPRKDHEHHNFIPQYTFCKIKQELLCTLSDAGPFYDIHADRVHNYFSRGFAQNLGALSLLNALMSSGFRERSLGIVVSYSSELMFTQKLCPFWLDYFNDSIESRSLSESIKNFSLDPQHKKWWDDALKRDEQGVSHIELSPLFLGEMFETALRIVVTPNDLLQEMARLTLGEDESADLFCTYFFNKIEQFKIEFQMIINAEENAWAEYRKHKGAHDIRTYLSDLFCFRIDETLVTQNLSANISESVILKGMSKFVSKMEQLCHVGTISKYTLDNRIACVRYFVYEAHQRWSDVSNQPDHKIWVILEQLTNGLAQELQWVDVQIQLPDDISIFLQDFLTTSIQLQKDNIATFLVLQNRELLTNHTSTSGSLTEVDVWVNQCLLYFDQATKQESLIDFLKHNCPKLPHNQIKTENILRPVARRARRSSFFLDNPLLVYEADDMERINHISSR